MSDSPTTAPQVAMLWEDADPDRVLRQRFGLDGAAAAGRWVCSLVGRVWGAHDVACERIVLSDVNALAWLSTDDGPRLAKWTRSQERFARLQQLAGLTGWLEGEGQPVSALVPARDGRLQVEHDGVSTGVQRVVRGELLDVDDPAQVRAAGAALARLHVALARWPGGVHLAGSPDYVDPRRALAGRLGADSSHLPAPAGALLRRLLREAPELGGAPQLVHGDVRSANVLCRGAEVVALLDLEEARAEQRVVELARAAVLLGTRFHDWAPVPGGVRQTFRAGYESVSRLSPAESRWFDVVELATSWAMVPTGGDPTGWGSEARAVTTRLGG
ncbi:phosphotransferase [Nocardioides sp. Leaf374]|uniref:phosphotransferase n=1 Tax=Nocardioides sp. Leaf374 TaxID=2876560 RepID=UPI001E32284E|nr:phosphotransferase [Nocardioides sp. Leaf374]